jgi:hypothetical protein
LNPWPVGRFWLFDPNGRRVVDGVSHVSDSHRKLISVAVDGHGMTTEDSDCVEFEVSLPEDLVVELDEYRAHCGYPSRSAVVTEALRE